MVLWVVITGVRCVKITTLNAYVKLRRMHHPDLMPVIAVVLLVRSWLSITSVILQPLGDGCAIIVTKVLAHWVTP